MNKVLGQVVKLIQALSLHFPCLLLLESTTKDYLNAQDGFSDCNLLYFIRLNGSTRMRLKLIKNCSKTSILSTKRIKRRQVTHFSHFLLNSN